MKSKKYLIFAILFLAAGGNRFSATESEKLNKKIAVWKSAILGIRTEAGFHT